MSARPRPLGSTYRLQLHGIGFEGARRIVGYLHDLGVETLYVSPILAAVPGSTHGYDVVDPARLDPALGSPEEFAALLDELGSRDMRLLIDVVPNHMATAPENHWWWGVLERGEEASSAPFFDIDWARAGHKVVLAVLGAPLDELLAEGAVVVDPAAGTLSAGGAAYPIDPATFEPAGEPAEVLERQHYRLAYWRVGPREVNYRRFFDIDQLIGVRVEDPEVYRATHAFVVQVAADGRVAGLRVDHVDGLADPAGYLRRLRDDLDATREEPAQILVEKILGAGESLPAGWAVQGTTGYEFAELTTRLFVDPDGARSLARLGAELTGERRDFDEIARQARREVLLSLFPGPADRLAERAHAALWRRHPGCDLTFDAVRRAIGALVAHLDVYRTYLDGKARPEDRRRIEHEAPEARQDLDVEGARALDALAKMLFDEPSEPVAIALEQLSSAVAAKGVEDTACYRYPGLLAAAEVGASPSRPAIDIDGFHAELALRARRSPDALNALSTHDTKRSADARARLAALSEVPEEWCRLVRRWHRRLAQPTGAGPDPFDELFFYQSALVLWPLGDAAPSGELGERLKAAMTKAAREAKRSTSWRDPDPAYEAALEGFVDRALADAGFADDLGRIAARLGPAAATYSLAMTVLAATAPGVPDVYQGSECWHLALMDPDNRRPVDHGRAAAQLAEPTEPADLVGRWVDGRIKLKVTAAVLGLRRAHPGVFARGRYVALEARGPERDRVVAFARRAGREWAVTIVPRRVIGLAGPRRFALGEAWGATRVLLPDGAPRVFIDALRGAEVRTTRGALVVREVLEELPVATLIARSP